MNTALGMILFLLLAPILGGFLAGLGAAISSGLQGEEPHHILRPAGELIILCRMPWAESGPQRLQTILCLIFILSSGLIFFGGGNIALSFLLLIVAEAVKVYKKHPPGRESEVTGLERSIASTAALGSQLFVIAAGFYCVAGLSSGSGSFLVTDIISGNIAPSFYMPAMLLGFVWLLLRVSNAGFSSVEEVEGFSGKGWVLFVITSWYRAIILYAVLFLLNYGGTVLSAVISVAICLLAGLFSLLLHRPISRPPGPAGVAVVSAVLLVASFINLLILLP